MDDFSVHSLIESKNEWCARLLNILTPMVISGFNSIWKDAYQVAIKNGEKKKYLMTFQNYLSQVPKWSTAIVDSECQRIVEKSGCNYLADLLSCVHIIQLKALSCVRVGQRQRKIDIDIPPLDVFIHNVYINCARKIYTNVYLFETEVPALHIQKNNRELEMIIRECIVNTIRDSIPTEKILRAYMDETEEEDVETKEEIINVKEEGEDDGDGENNEGQTDAAAEDVKKKEEEKKEEEKKNEKEALTSMASTINVDTDDISSASASSSSNTESDSEKRGQLVISKESSMNIMDDIETPKSLKFNDKDEAMTSNGKVEVIDAPKDIDRLEKISEESFARRKAEEEEDDEEENLNIGGDVMLELDEIVSLEDARF
jgi:hypothetical protein